MKPSGGMYSDRDTFNSNGADSTSLNTNQSGKFIKVKDIEDEEYIYKVPCAARDTISLRDSVKPVNAAEVKKNHEKNKKKPVMSTDFKNIPL